MISPNALPSLILLLLFLFHGVQCDDPYRFLTWKVTNGDIYPLGVKQQVPHLLSSLLHWVIHLDSFNVAFFLFNFNLQGILINGQFPGPQIDAVTNDNLIISVYNYLREPLLISW